MSERCISERRRVERAVMVLGGAPEAAQAVEALLRRGYAVHWVRAGRDLPPAEAADPNLTPHDECELLSLSGEAGALRATLRRQGLSFEAPVSALLIATGNARVPWQPAGLPPAALRFSQLARQLDDAAARPAAPAVRRERLALVPAEGVRESAAEALELAERALAAWRCEVAVFYRDLPVDAPGLERRTRLLRERGVVFCRYEALAIAAEGEQLTVMSSEGSVAVDRLALGENVAPAPETAALAARLALRLGADGYFQDVNIHPLRAGLASRRGVMLAGRCHADLSLEEALADATRAVAGLDALIGTGWIEAEPVRARVDARRCVRCLTCVRSCPHAAVEVVEYPEEAVLAARVGEMACRGCGACVANCPVQAITLAGAEALPGWLQEAVPGGAGR